MMLHEVFFFREAILGISDICYLKNNKKADRYFKKISEDEVVEINRIYPYDYTIGNFKENDTNIKIIRNEFHYIETNKKYKLEKKCIQNDSDLIDFGNKKICYFIEI